MVSTSTHRRGNLDKRMQSTPFRSVLSLDVEYKGSMPNLKISNRNTIRPGGQPVVVPRWVQATGCQNMEVLSDILHYLVTTYRNRGFDVPEPEYAAGPVAFVGDIVLANIHFKLGWRVDRTRLRDVMNQDQGVFVASYEPLVRDVSVSIKAWGAESAHLQCPPAPPPHFEDDPLPNDGAVYPMWSLGAPNQWTTVRYADVLRLVPHSTIRQRPRCHTFRVFATGSVVQVGRWPHSMRQVYDSFQRYMAEVRAKVMDQFAAHQRTIPEVWWPTTNGPKGAAAETHKRRRLVKEEEADDGDEKTHHHAPADGHHPDDGHPEDHPQDGAAPDPRRPERAAAVPQTAPGAVPRRRHHRAAGAPVPRVDRKQAGFHT